MRIVYYAPTWPPGDAANGIVTYVAAMRDALLGDGHDVSVVSQGRLHTADGEDHDLGDGESRSAGLWSRLRRRIDSARGDHPFSAARLARQLRAAQAVAPFDLVEMEESFGWSRAVQRALDVPVVTRLHGPRFLRPAGLATGAEERQSRQRAAAEGRAIGCAPALSAPTAATIAAARSHYRHALRESAVIPNPVPPGDDARSRPGGDAETILYVGRFDHYKGADTVLDAFRLLAARRPAVRLVMVGPDIGLALPGGPTLRYADYADAYLSPCVRARIDFTGPLSQARIAGLRQRASLAVAASRNETFHYAAMEAMAAGIPLVSTDWPGCSELIEDGVTGWLTPVGRADRLAERIAWVLDHRQAAERVGAAAWRHCRDTYSPDKVGRRSAAFYADVLSRHAARR